MSIQSDRQVVQEYCRKNNKSAVITALTYSVFQKQFEELIEDNTDEEGAPSKTKIDAMRMTLLSDASLNAHLRVAEEMQLSETQDVLQPFMRKESIKNFWHSVSASVVASFIYSVLLIVIFIVAQEQIGTWLSSLTVKP